MGDDDAYVKWLSKATLALAEDKDTLTKLTAGGIAKDSMVSQAKKLNTSAALWGVVNKEEDIPDFKGKMSSAYGTLDLKGGNMTADVHLVLDSAKTATDGAAQAQQRTSSRDRQAHGHFHERAWHSHEPPAQQAACLYARVSRANGVARGECLEPCGPSMNRHWRWRSLRQACA